MESVLVKLKAVLNAISNEELENYDLWIDCQKGIRAIAIDDNAITLISEDTELKINGAEW